MKRTQAKREWDRIVNPSDNQQTGELPRVDYSDLDDDTPAQAARRSSSTKPNRIKDQDNNGQDGN
jgi:hypothetical protein